LNHSQEMIEHFQEAHSNSIAHPPSHRKLHAQQGLTLLGTFHLLQMISF